VTDIEEKKEFALAFVQSYCDSSLKRFEWDKYFKESFFCLDAGKTWEDLGRLGKTWEDLGRLGKTWEDLGRLGKTWEDLGIPLHFKMVVDEQK
jgi:hypothetical protein